MILKKQRKSTENMSASAPEKKVRKLSVGKKIRLGILAFIAVYLIAALLSLIANGHINTAVYSEKTDKINGSVRVVLISDLHRTKFGADNEQLVERTAEQHPDIIAVDGDMLERDYTQDELDDLVGLFERLVRIAPVYFSVGNHDYCAFFKVIDQLGGDYLCGIEKNEALTRLENTGAVFLENEYRDIEVNGQKIRIGGFYGHAMQMEYDLQDGGASWARRKAFLQEFCGTDSYKLMLSHRPESFVRRSTEADWDIDLILCGHTHNGVLSLPFGLGAIWGSEGLFPKHDRGEFKIGTRSTMIITAGLAGWRSIPRVFNPPEIAVIDILGK